MVETCFAAKNSMKMIANSDCLAWGRGIKSFQFLACVQRKNFWTCATHFRASGDKIVISGGLGDKIGLTLWAFCIECHEKTAYWGGWEAGTKSA